MEPASDPSLWFILIAFLALLTPLVFVHEMGHYLVARWNGVRVETFSIGFGPEIVGWNDSKGTRWKISWVPLGGYVKFFGDAGAASTPGEGLTEMTPEERAVAFHHKGLGQRAAIVAAGPIVNFLFAILIFAGFYVSYGQAVTQPVITGLAEGGAAETAGFQLGDRITTIDGDRIENFQDIVGHVVMYPEQRLLVTVERGDQLVDIAVVPKRHVEVDRFGNRYERGLLGIEGRETEIVSHGPISALWVSTVRTVELTETMLIGLGQVIMGVRSLDELGGPVKIAKFAGQQASLGFERFISFVALVSINLGLVNLLPIPMLDGGHLLYYGAEAVRGKPLSARVQEFGYMVGLALVLSLLIFLTWNDLTS